MKFLYNEEEFFRTETEVSTFMLTILLAKLDMIGT